MFSLENVMAVETYTTDEETGNTAAIVIQKYLGPKKVKFIRPTMQSKMSRHG